MDKRESLTRLLAIGPVRVTYWDQGRSRVGEAECHLSATGIGDFGLMINTGRGLFVSWSNVLDLRPLEYLKCELGYN